MYDKLIKQLRECTEKVNGEKTLWHQAADAIEERQVVVDGLTAQTNMVFEKTEGRTVIKFEPKWIPVTERLPKEEVRDAGVDYDNLDYLINLVHIYEKCKKFADVEFKGAFLLKEASGIAKVDP